MATRGIDLTIPFIAWDTANNVGKTGDAANITMKWFKDGPLADPTNATVSEVSAISVPGLYTITLTDVETDCNLGCLHGISGSIGVSIMPVIIQFERLPDFAPTQPGGVLDTQMLLGSGLAVQNLREQVEYIERGTIQAVAGLVTTLENTAQTSVLNLEGMIIIIVSSSGKKLQTRRIESYNPANQQATIDKAWDVNPNGETYHILGLIL